MVWNWSQRHVNLVIWKQLEDASKRAKKWKAIELDGISFEWYDSLFLNMKIFYVSSIYAR